MALPFHKLLAALGGGNPGITAIQKYGASLYLPGVTAYEDNHVASDGSGGLAVANDYIGYAKDITGSLNLTQATTGFKPQLLDTAGVKSWKFDGVDDGLNTAGSVIASTSAPYFLCFLIKMPPTVVVGGGVGIFGANAAGIQRINIFIAADNGIDFYSTGVTGSALIDASPPRAVNEYVLITVYTSGGNSTLRINGSINSPYTGSTTNTSTSGALTASAIGKLLSPSGFFFNSHVLSVIAGNGSPTLDEITAMENFLASRAGITLV